MAFLNDQIPPSSKGSSVFSQKERGWKQRYHKGVKIHFCGKFNTKYFSHLIKILLSGDQPNLSMLEAHLIGCTNNNSFIIETDRFTFASTDRLRTKPIFYTTVNESIHVSTCPKNIAMWGQNHICPNAALAIQMSGCTIGRETIYEAIFQLCAGEYLFASANRLRVSKYSHYITKSPKELSMEQACKELRNVTLGIFEELRDKLDGTPILIPLSAGYDSRLVISALKFIGTKNLRSVSYGYENGFEVSTAREIALYLGVPWFRITPHSKQKTAFLRSSEFTDYLDYVDNLSSVPFLQDIHHFWELKREHGIDDGTYVINGNTGDFISGNHIPADFNENPNVDDIVEKICEKHFSLWKHDVNSQNLADIKIMLTDELLSYKNCGEFLNTKNAFILFESFEFLHRQTKYVISGQQAYEYLGFRWALPLWHGQFIDFWSEVPFQLKIHQRLYRHFLLSENWMGVWQNLPLNKKNITPKWIVYPRLLAKAVHFFSGKESWHRFERRYFQYFMDVTGTYRRFEYQKIIKDCRGARNQMAFLAEEYLTNKGVPITLE